MSGRSVLMAVALSLWLLISVAVFVTVAYVGLIGVGVVGLMMWFICTLAELDTDAVVGGDLSAGFLAQQVATKTGQTQEERTTSFGERLRSVRSVHFFRNLGALLAVTGIGGFLLFQL